MSGSKTEYVERHEDGSTAVQALNEIKSAENPDGTYDATVHEIVDDPEELDMSGDEIVITFDVQVGPHVTGERPDFTLDFPDEFDEFVSWAGDAESPVGAEVRLERDNDEWSLPFREEQTLSEIPIDREDLFSSMAANVIFASAFLSQIMLLFYAISVRSIGVSLIALYNMLALVLISVAD